MDPEDYMRSVGRGLSTTSLQIFKRQIVSMYQTLQILHVVYGQPIRALANLRF